MSSLVVFSRDPGPTNLLVAAIDTVLAPPSTGETAGLAALRSALGRVQKQIRVASRPPGLSIWREEGYSAIDWDGRDQGAADDLLRDWNAGAVLTGTSDVDEASDRHLWRSAAARNIESHALLDHPAFLAMRFSGADGAPFWPSFIYVADAVFSERLEGIGAPPDRIRMIGDLHHSRLRRLLRSSQPTAVPSLRSRWGATDDTFVILFISDCVREMTQAGLTFDYDEIETLERLLSGLAKGDLPNGDAINPARALVVVRLHPRDGAGKYDGVAGRFSKDLRIEVSSEGVGYLALAAANLVAGMNSSMLYEAVALGRTAVSLTGHDISAGKSHAI